MEGAIGKAGQVFGITVATAFAPLQKRTCRQHYIKVADREEHIATDNSSESAEAPAVAPALKRGAFGAALFALVLPLAAFALAWTVAGKIPLAVPKAEWGLWFFMGALFGVAGITGLVFACKAFARGGYRSMVVAAFVLNLVILVIGWAGLFA
jgi:hypothetical protein